MKAPKVLEVDDKIFIHVRDYPYFHLYKHYKGLYCECFDNFTIMQINMGTYKPRKTWFR